MPGGNLETQKSTKAYNQLTSAIDAEIKDIASILSN